MRGGLAVLACCLVSASLALPLSSDAPNAHDHDHLVALLRGVGDVVGKHASGDDSVALTDRADDLLRAWVAAGLVSAETAEHDVNVRWCPHKSYMEFIPVRPRGTARREPETRVKGQRIACSSRLPFTHLARVF